MLEKGVAFLLKDMKTNINHVESITVSRIRKESFLCGKITCRVECKVKFCTPTVEALRNNDKTQMQAINQ